MQNDLDTPKALSLLGSQDDEASSLRQLTINRGLNKEETECLIELFETIDAYLGLGFLSSKDITGDVKQLIKQRQEARDNKDYTESDRIRDELLGQGIEILDNNQGSIWLRK